MKWYRYIEVEKEKFEYLLEEMLNNLYTLRSFIKYEDKICAVFEQIPA